MFRKACHDCWFFCLVCIHFVNMNQSLYLLFQYLCQGAASLEGYYFMLDGHRKRQCFLSKRRLNGIYLRASKLNSLALLVNKLEQHESKTSQENRINMAKQKPNVTYQCCFLEKYVESTFFQWLKFFSLIYFL